MQRLIQIEGGLHIKDSHIFIGDPVLEKKKWMNIDLKPGLYQCNTFLKSKDGSKEHAIIDQVSILSMDDKPKTKPTIKKYGSIYISSNILGFILPNKGNSEVNFASMAIFPDKAILQENAGFFIHAMFQNLYSLVYTFSDTNDNIIGITIPIQ